MQTDGTTFGWLLTALALAGLVASLAALLWVSPLGVALRNGLADCWNGFRRMGAFGQVIVVVGLCICWQRGAAKWSPVQHGGGDDILTVTGIYTDVTNVVDESVSPPVTNAVPMVRVEWLGNGGTEETPVSIRASETNEWTEIVKLEPVVTQEGITNVLTFAAETNYAHVAYWWFGTDKPAIIVTTEGIEIRNFEVTTKTVRFAWVCGEPNVTYYEIKRREQGAANWETVGRVDANVGAVNEWTGRLFTVDKTYDWQIVTEVEDVE